LRVRAEPVSLYGEVVGVRGKFGRQQDRHLGGAHLGGEFDRLLGADAAIRVGLVVDQDRRLAGEQRQPHGGGRVGAGDLHGEDVLAGGGGDGRLRRRPPVGGGGAGPRGGGGGGEVRPAARPGGVWGTAPGRSRALPVPPAAPPTR